MTAARVLEELLALPPDERREVVLRALETLEDSIPPEVEDAWYAEVQGRRRRLESGETKPVPWEAVQARLLADEV